MVSNLLCCQFSERSNISYDYKSSFSFLNWIVLTVVLIRSSRSQLPVGIRAASLQQSKCMLMDNLSLSVLDHVEVFITATGNHPRGASVPLFCIEHSSKFPFFKSSTLILIMLEAFAQISSHHCHISMWASSRSSSIRLEPGACVRACMCVCVCEVNCFITGPSTDETGEILLILH